MKKYLSYAVAFLTILLCQDLRGGGIEWLRNFDDAKREAFLRTKLILIYFEKGSIEEGFKMETETWNQPQIIELSKRFVCLRADMQQWRLLRDQYERLRRTFRVDVVPTIIVTDPVCSEYYRSEGFIRAEDLQEVLKILPRNLFNLYQMLKEVHDNPSSVNAKINAGIAYHRIRVAHLSNMYLEEVLRTDTVKSNKQLEESVETYRAINYYLLGDLKKSINMFERLLDRFPEGEKQQVHLFYLIKIHLEDFSETVAGSYLNIFKKRFPNSSYIKQAEDLFKKRE